MARRTIPHSRPSLRPSDRRAVERVLTSGWLAEGPEVARLEGDFARHLGVGHAVAVASGTAALHLVLLALGVRPGERVLTASYGCVAILDALAIADRGEFLNGSTDVQWVDDRRSRLQRVISDARLDAAELLLGTDRRRGAS